jgi:hypothetical protein
MAKFRLRVVSLVGGVLFCGILGLAQISPSDQTAPPPPPPRPQFFAGTVVELDQQHIRVTRTLVGRPTENRNFVINAATKMNKTAVKLHSRITVRYRRQPEGDVALEIQLRPVIVRTPKA